MYFEAYMHIDLTNNIHVCVLLFLFKWSIIIVIRIVIAISIIIIALRDSIHMFPALPLGTRKKRQGLR